MKRGIQIIEYFILVALGLLVVFAMAWPELTSLAPRSTPIEVTAIIRESDAAAWANVRLGMEQAAYDLGVYLRFLTPVQGNDAQEQQTLLLREAERGSSALAVVPVSAGALNDLLETQNLSVPLITLETQVEGAASSIFFNDIHIGQLLAQAVLDDAATTDVILLNLTPESSSVILRINAAQALLQQAGFTVQVCEKDRFEQAITGQNKVAVICLEQYATLHAANLLAGQNTNTVLYGVGASSRSIANLERGTIAALVVWNEYIAGYLSVQQAVLAAENKPVESNELTVSIIRRDDIYEMENQKLLFPVTK